VSGVARGPPDPLTRRAGDPGGAVSPSRDSDAYSVGSWAGVHREPTQTLADRALGGAALYRARVPLGERVGGVR
jgi:hypothetical protein